MRPNKLPLLLPAPALVLPVSAQLTGELDPSFDVDGIKVLDMCGDTDRGQDIPEQV